MAEEVVLRKILSFFWKISVSKQKVLTFTHSFIRVGPLARVQCSPLIRHYCLVISIAPPPGNFLPAPLIIGKTSGIVCFTLCVNAFDHKS